MSRRVALVAASALAVPTRTILAAAASRSPNPQNRCGGAVGSGRSSLPLAAVLAAAQEQRRPIRYHCYHHHSTTTTTTTTTSWRINRWSCGASAQLHPQQPLQPLQRRWLSEDSSSISSNNRQNQVPAKSQPDRRRRLGTKRQKRPPPLITTRDRLRALQETNLIRHKSLLDRSHLENVVDLARSRIDYWRIQLFSYWNPDYAKQQQQQQQHKQHTTTTSDSLRIRRFQQTTIMDERWWFWNIVMALTPAALIALYCEFRMKPIQEAFGRKQSLAELRIIMGDNYNEEWALEMVEARNLDELRQWQKENGYVEGESVRDGFQKFMALVWNMLRGGKELDGNEANRGPIRFAGGLQQQRAGVSSPPTVTPQPSEHRPDVKDGAGGASSTTPSSPSIQQPTTTEQQPSSLETKQQPPPLEEILMRLRRLEEQARTTPPPLPHQEETKEEASQRYLKQIDDFRKSGTRKRFEGEQFRQWEKYLQEVPPPDPNRPKKESTQPSSSSFQGSLTTLYSSIKDTVQSLLGSDDDDQGNGGKAQSSEQRSGSTSSSSSDKSQNKSSGVSSSISEQSLQQQQHQERSMVLDDHEQHRDTLVDQDRHYPTAQTATSESNMADSMKVRTTSDDTSLDADGTQAPNRPWWGIWRKAGS